MRVSGSDKNRSRSGQVQLVQVEPTLLLAVRRSDKLRLHTYAYPAYPDACMRLRGRRGLIVTTTTSVAMLHLLFHCFFPLEWTPSHSSLDASFVSSAIRPYLRSLSRMMSGRTVRCGDSSLGTVSLPRTAGRGASAGAGMGVNAATVTTRN